ncbi:MAG: redox-regulated ATPase YchF [Flavobacteriales bacterium]|jgi:GTP-binding protein YchF|uniref:redox-regulated ATPase YchF n=1 Tax=Blattabacterium sp. (Mastotermes darwiniensis) TaxID=39768 RepID=UPI000231DFA8|nr:redox-regulated ATPase YchF [Blattabacterium sp. (Mastotermes darwiniensis)]AER40448.1 putative ATP/GTP-binding protein [Blattabacterium sp. (Mastotermes darwiniensis) str. MADAR]MDR1805036.1 redox-regulated ATPase YchF [Flavobacteriales bacterium]
MKCGIIGLPNIGKSTLFNLISNSKALSENFPFCTKEPNYGVTKVPDSRLDELRIFINPMKIVPSTIKIIDIAGLIKGSHKGEGLGNKFLSHIRETNAIIHMIRFFRDMRVLHVEGSINPIRDKEIIDIELQLKDLETIEKRLEKNKKYKNSIRENTLLQKIFSFLKEGKNIRMFPFKKEEKKYIEDLHLLTIKPILYVCNIDVCDKKDNYLKEIKKMVGKEKSNLVVVSLKKESTSQKKNGISIIDKVIQEAYKLLKLQSFFTIGKKEIRAWAIPNHWTAYQASSIIHTDLKKGFICAEVIHYKDFIKYRSKEKAKRAGRMFLVGREYLIRDGDIIHFRFNR